MPLFIPGWVGIVTLCWLGILSIWLIVHAISVRDDKEWLRRDVKRTEKELRFTDCCLASLLQHLKLKRNWVGRSHEGWEIEKSKPPRKQTKKKVTKRKGK